MHNVQWKCCVNFLIKYSFWNCLNWFQTEFKFIHLPTHASFEYFHPVIWIKTKSISRFGPCITNQSTSNVAAWPRRIYKIIFSTYEKVLRHSYVLGSQFLMFRSSVESSKECVYLQMCVFVQNNFTQCCRIAFVCPT